jgi:hypothetical protein
VGWRKMIILTRISKSLPAPRDLRTQQRGLSPDILPLGQCPEGRGSLTWSQQQMWLCPRLTLVLG